MLNTEKLFTKLEFAYIMNYYRLKVACSKQRRYLPKPLAQWHCFTVYLYDISIFISMLTVIFQLPFDIFINNNSLYHIIIYFSSVDIDNLNILLKTPHLRAANNILSASFVYDRFRSYYLIYVISVYLSYARLMRVCAPFGECAYMSIVS